MSNSHRSISDILSPALAAVALSVFIAGCTSSTTTDTDVMNNASEMTMSSQAIMEGSSSSASTSSEAMMESSAAAMDESAYNDGTYRADGVYRSPAGAEEIHVTVTLKDDIITDAHVESTATNPKSKMMQAAFIAGFSTQVVGKSIDELSLGVVNGSSLTPKGFMDAVAKIKVEAAS